LEDHLPKTKKNYKNYKKIKKPKNYKKIKKPKKLKKLFRRNLPTKNNNTKYITKKLKFFLK
jgi:hypothetical protein